MQRLAIVVPCCNEEEVLPDTVRQLTQLLAALVKKQKISPDSFLLLVDDGSTDGTWRLMTEAFDRSSQVEALRLAGNAGQQNALFAGLAAVVERCDMAVTVDADLQDDIGVMERMIDCFRDGADVVYGVRSERKTDTFFKRSTALLFYRLIEWLGANTVYNHAEYRLMSARVLRQLMRYGERNLFLRGIVPLIGFRSEKVYYARKPRAAGKSKYPLSRMLATALEGVTSFSIRPITLTVLLGGGILLCTLAAMIYILASRAAGKAVSGWASIMASVWFLGGLELVAVGAAGEYVGKTYLEVKRRPRYHIEQFLRHGDSAANEFCERSDD